MTTFNTKQYITHATYHQCLLFASFLILPRSSYPGVQRISIDRPEHPFLTPITSSPIRTMLWTVLGVGVCSMLWGQHLRTWTEGSQRPKDRDERVKRTAMKIDMFALAAGDVHRLKEAGIATVIAIPCMFILLYILGAPLYKWVESLLVSTQFSLLVVWPAVQALGLPSLRQAGFAHRFRYTRLFCSLQPETPVERIMVHSTVGAVLGAWFGTVLLALDWDRPWQSYPLTPAFGMLLGYTIGSYVV